ncbi:hypothetical protein [Chryseobacterium sp. SIMBA_029]|uniref:hypothetical protein n=1 Tax=Chryseobacterium sp. SIMBA_029 TaxID=3085772 RepID=UPI00397B7FF5
MIQIKLLELKDRNISGFNSYSDFVTALNNFLGITVEVVFEQDKSFGGYYLTPIGAIPSNEFDENLINEKTFLLSVINSSIPQYIENFNPAGLTNWMLFKDASTSIIGKIDALKKYGELEEETLKRDLEYDYYVPIPFDGTYETVAKSILQYLEIYDKYLNNK